MWCSSPPPLSDDQITAHLDHESDATVIEHIQICAACASRVAQAQRVEQTLHTLRRFDCPPPATLGQYHLGLLPSAQERPIMRHLAECAACTAELEDMRVFMADDIAPQLIPVTPPPRPVPSRVRFGELVARLVPRSASMALRGAATGPIMAEAGETTLMLDVQPLGDQATIMGQIVADAYEPWVGALVELRQDGELQATTTVDDMGVFTFDGIRAAASALRVTPPIGAAIVLENVDLA